MKKTATIGWVLSILACFGACTPDPARTGPEALEAALAEAHPGMEDHNLDDGSPLQGCKPHRMTMMGAMTLRGDHQSTDQKVVIQRVIDRGPDGAFSIDDQRTWTDPELAPSGYTDRRLILSDGELLAVKRSGGPWMERETLGGHAQRLLTSAYDVAPTILNGLKRHLQLQAVDDDQAVGLERGGFDPGPVGLDVQWYAVTLASDSGAGDVPGAKALRSLRSQESTWDQWLSQTHKPTGIEGSLARTRGSDGGVVVSGALELDGSATVEGVKREFTLALRISVDPLPSAVSFQLPEDRLPATRDRPWQMIEDVLGDNLSERYDRDRPKKTP
ncbi:MAG: hypothetical protein VYE15_04620 [Myxococcota bacterium]|nr:hypothetical protein [Myxococcota bacterium]